MALGRILLISYLHCVTIFLSALIHSKIWGRYFYAEASQFGSWGPHISSITLHIFPKFSWPQFPGKFAWGISGETKWLVRNRASHQRVHFAFLPGGLIVMSKCSGLSDDAPSVPDIAGAQRNAACNPPSGVNGGPEEFHGRPKRKSKHLSVNRGPEFPTPPPSPQLRPHAHAKPAASARAVTSSRGGPAPGRAAHRVGGGSRASLDAASRNRGSLSARAPGEGRWRQRACVRLAEWRRRTAGLARGTRSGSPGWSGWGALGYPCWGGEEGEGDGEGAQLLGRASLLLGWGGAGWTDPAVRLCWALPTELVIYLSEDETKPPRKVRCAYLKPGTRSEYTPRAWGSSPRGMTTYLCARHRADP